MQQESNNEAVNHAAAQRRQQQPLQAVGGGACKHPIIISNQKQCFRAAMKRGTKTPAAWSHAAALRPTAGTRTRTRSGLAGGPAVSAAERSEVLGSGPVLDLTGGSGDGLMVLERFPYGKPF